MLSLLERQQAFQAMLLASSSDERQAGIAVYRNNIRAALTLALRLSFPAILRLLGEDCFRAHAARFICAQPPREGDLHLYGDAFAAALAGSPLAAALPYLADVARLDWAAHRALHASLAAPLTPQALRAAQGDSVFVAQPSLSRLTLRRDARAIWTAVLKQDDAALARIVPGPGEIHAMVMRGLGGLEIFEVSPEIFAFAGALVQGLTLEQACAGMGDAEAAEALGLCLTRNLFTGFTPTGREELPCP